MRKNADAKPPRVALFASAFHPSLGGVEELVRQLALEYQRRGMAVVVVTNRWPRNLPAAENIGGVPVLRFPLRLPDGGFRGRWGYRLTAARIRREVLQAMEEFAPDVVHVQCVSANAWYASCVASELGVPLVVSLQGERTMDAQCIYERSPVMNRVLLGALRSATWVTACSGATLRDAARFAPGAFSPNRARVVFNGIGREAFEPRKGFGWPRPYIFALGRLVPQKGFDVLVQAFAQAGKNLTDLLIAGEGPEGVKLGRLIADLGLSGRVALLGRADRASVHALMGQSIGVVVPSLREPMGIVVLEALAAGKPLVASRVDGIPEVVPPCRTARLVRPGDAAELAEALRWLSGFRGAAPFEEHITHARRFCWEHIAGEYLETYHRNAAVPPSEARPACRSNSNSNWERDWATPLARG